MKKAIIIACAILFQNALLAGTITSSKTGNWTSNSSWITNERPLINDTVLISKEDTIYINSSAAVCKYLIIEGTAFFRSPTNKITTNVTLLRGGTITGTATGTLTSDSLTTKETVNIGAANISVNNFAINHDSLIFKSSSGTKYFKQFINLGTLLNPHHEDFTFGNSLRNEGILELKESSVSFTHTAEIKGKKVIEVDALTLADTLIVIDSLQVNSSVVGEQLIINKGDFLLGATNGNTKVLALDLSHKDNTIHFIRNGQQALDLIKDNSAHNIGFSGDGAYKINSVITAKTLKINGRSKLTLAETITVDSLIILDKAVLDITKESYLSGFKNIVSDWESEIILNKMDTITPENVQVGSITLNTNAVLNLTLCDSLFISGNVNGPGSFEGDNTVIYNGQNNQNIKEFAYNDLVIDNTSNTELNFIGNYTLEGLFIKKGKFKLGSSTIKQAIVNTNGEIIIGASTPRFLNKTILQGTLEIASNAANPTFDTLIIKNNALFKSNYAAEIVVTSILDNNGVFLATEQAGSKLVFSNNNGLITGDGQLNISRIEGSHITNSSNVLITRSLYSVLFTNARGSLLQLKAQQNNISSAFDFSANNNTVEFSGTNQAISAQMNVFENLLISGTGSTNLSNNTLINNNLIISNTAILDCDSFQITAGNDANMTLDSGSYLLLGHNFSDRDIQFPLNFTTTYIDDSSTVIYQAKGDQSIKAMAYGNLIIDDGAVNESNKAVNGTKLAVHGNFTIEESSVVFNIDDKVVNLYGDWNGLGIVKLNNGALNIYGNCNSNGAIDAGNSTISYLGGKRQRIKVGTYFDMVIDKNNTAYTRANLGSIEVTNDLWVKKGTLDFSTEKVRINHLLIDDTVLFSSNLQLKTFNHITVGSEGYFNLAIDDHIFIEGDIENEGQFIISQGAVTLSDSTKNQTISGTGTYELQNCNIDKDTFKTIIASDLLIDDTLSITSGKLRLEDALLRLGGNGYLSGLTEQNTLTGTDESAVITERLILPGNYYNIAGLELNIQTPTPMGTTLIKRGFKSYSLAGNQAINRFYDISPLISNNLNVNMSFNYYTSELNLNTEEALKVWKSIDNGANWSLQGGAIDTTTKQITINNITSFSKWTAGSEPLVALAVDLKSFTGNRHNDQITLNWEVLAEINTKAYLVKYSLDGVRYDSLTTIAASNAINYTTTANFNVKQTVFFKLIEIEEDGTELFLDTLIVIAAEPEKPTAYLYGNQIVTKNFEAGNVMVYNTNGKLLLQNNADLSALPIANYFVVLQNSKGKWSFKVPKNN